jgi:small subunit ribosomal protein S6
MGRRTRAMLQWRDFLPRHRDVRSERRKPARPIQTRGRRARNAVVKYEILLMLDPELADERQEEILTRTRELVQRGGGTWVGHDIWGRRRLAYEIRHKNEGVYHLLQFDADSETLEELSRILRITDGVMRHMATRRIDGSQTSAPPEPPESVPEPTYAGTNTSSQEE